MRRVAQRVVRIGRPRRQTWNGLGGSSPRYLSDQAPNEKEALLRALGSTTPSTPEASPSENTVKQDESKKEKTLPSGRKHLSLNSFFDNLKSSDHKRPRKKTKSRNRNRRRPEMAPDASEDSVKNVKKVNISSFFDEVNEIMRKKKAANNTHDTKQDQTLNNPVTSPPKASMPTPTKSILDMLPPPRTRSPDAYDEEAFDQYLEMLDTIMENPRFLRKHTASPLGDERAKSVIEWLTKEEPAIPCNLPLLEKAIQKGLSGEEESDAPTIFRAQLAKQRQALIDHHGWDADQYEIAMGALFSMGNHCAKHATAPPLDIAWQKMKEAGYKMNKSTLHNYLYVSSTFSVRAVPNLPLLSGSILDLLSGDERKETTIQEKEEAPPSDEPIDVATEAALSHDLLFEPSEQSTSIRVRVLVSQGRAKEAEKLLNMNPKNDDLRLRTYDPVYQCYLDQGDVSSAFKLYQRMRAGENVLLRPETYVQLIACIAENGYFKPGSEPIEGVKEMGYAYGSGPQLFDILASELADNSVEITSASAKRLYNALQSGFPEHGLKPLHLLESLQTCNEPASQTELVASRVTLDKTTGRCPRTDNQLRLINLNSQQKGQLRDGLMYLSATSYEERSGKKNSKAEDELRKFGSWLENRSGEPFTAIVDGPNVAYYFQNFEQGTFNFHQIKFVVDALEKMGENVLVVLPKKYTQKSFMLTKSSGRTRQRLSEKERKICDDLISSGRAYIVPVGCLDDYYWMYASVTGQGNVSSEEEVYIPPDNAEGRWPGVRPMLVSNDKMRDHKLSLLEPRLFRRWYSNFLVNFTFSAFVGDVCVDKEIGFSTADFYSREIQGNQVHDQDGEECGLTWHFPVSDWNDDESFCVRIPLRAEIPAGETQDESM